MKTAIVCVLVMLFSSATITYAAKEIIPPGTVKINDSLFIDQTEIRNLDYAEYVYWNYKVKGPESDEYASSLPDTNVWSSAFNEPFVKLYFRHPAYREYPVVGVSYEQAVAYCEWRSDRVNEFIYIKENKIDYSELKNIKDVPQKFHYRLPTKEEWEGIAALDYSKKTKNQLKKKKYFGMKMYNLIHVEDMIADSDNADITAPVKSYWPNSLGVFCIIGNVAEMTSEKGLAKGGSWKHKNDEVQVEKDFAYEKPESWLGFRCVCEKVNI